MSVCRVFCGGLSGKLLKCDLSFLFILIVSFGFIENAFSKASLSLEIRDITKADCDFRDNGTLIGCEGTVTSSMDVPVLENDFIRIELLPGFGGRVRSVVYKPTGNEETNPSDDLGSPNNRGTGNFFYDFLWAVGGFYPTIGPEHGKYFHLPWSWEVTKDTEDTVAVTMYMVDSIPWREGCASKFSAYYDTWIEVDYTVRVIAGRTGYQAEITLRNPDDQAHQYEYWSNTSMFPGGSGSSEGYEMIAPIDTIQIDYWCGALEAVEEPFGDDNMYYFDNLRFIRNWPAAGILYAHNYPYSFWGVIDHNEENEEGIIRVCDNNHTIGLKVWGAPPSLFEPWGGTTNRFFSPVTIEAGEVKNWKEWYTPTVGLSNISHANELFIVNLTTDKQQYDGSVDSEMEVSCQLFTTMPGLPADIAMYLDGEGVDQKIYEGQKIADLVNGNIISFSVPLEDVYNPMTSLKAEISNSTENSLLTADVGLDFTNCSDVLNEDITASETLPYSKNKPLIKQNRSYPLSVYDYKGRLISECKNREELKRLNLPAGIHMYKFNTGQQEVIKSVRVE